MFVVRIQNDEAVMYRAFRRFQSAKIWAAERDAESVECLVDILESPEAEDPRLAVAQAKTGKSQPLVRGEALSIPVPFVAVGSDIEFGRFQTA